MQINYYFIYKNNLFPNNEKLPVLHYKRVFEPLPLTPELIEHVLNENDWHHVWRDGIYSFHHYHSNTHEVLIIYSGHCIVELGGEQGKMIEVTIGDALLIPAGISHKNHQASSDFKCIGAYPFSIEYNMKYGKVDEYPQVIEEIKRTPLPQSDPIYGKEGPLFNYWQTEF